MGRLPEHCRANQSHNQKPRCLHGSPGESATIAGIFLPSLFGRMGYN
jgi:hypothetical protein